MDIFTCEMFKAHILQVHIENVGFKHFPCFLHHPPEQTNGKELPISKSELSVFCRGKVCCVTENEMFP